MFKIKLPNSTQVLNITQTIVLVGTLVITIVIAVRNEHFQSNRDSGDFMLKFDERMYNGASGIIAKTLDRDRNLDKLHLDITKLDDDFADFFGNYELLAKAYQHGLIDGDMASDAFQYDLEHALNDPKAREYLRDARNEEDDLYAGVFYLASEWEIKYPPIETSKPQ